MEYIVVIAGNKREFDNFIRPWMTPNEAKQFRYAGSYRDVVGIKISNVVKIGTWQDKRDAHEILDLCNYRKERTPCQCMTGTKSTTPETSTSLFTSL